IRQMRHLAEKPSDFLRLPVFIIVSTTFLMPIRLIGFFRMAHASGWGTRAGAYAGGAENDEIEAREREGQPELVMAGAATTPQGPGMTAVSPKRASTRTSTAPRKKPHRKLNPKAAIPYLIGIGIFTLEAILIV
ncbi:MAG: glycosyl transferase family 2, partial [Microterricola sp.]